MTFGTNVARYLTASPLRGAALGAGIGAASGALRTPVEGQSRGQQMMQGAIRGGAVGGAVSGVGRAYRDTRLLRPELGAGTAVGATAGRLGTGVLNFARRQVHGLTGIGNPDAIGMHGTVHAGQKAKLLRLRAADEAKGLSGDKLKALHSATDQEIDGVLAAGRHVQANQDAGITSVPGIYKALKDPARRGVALRAMGRTVTQGGLGTGALALGVPLATSAPSLLKGDESATGGHTVGQKLKALGAGIGVSAATGGLPIIPQMVLGTAGDMAARRAILGKEQR